MKKRPAFLIVIILSLLLNSCKKDEQYKQYADVTITTLQKWYNEETGLYETTSWWNSANALTAIIDYSRITGSKEYLDVIENSFTICKEFEVQMPDSTDNWTCINYINDFYDDEGWWILTWIDAYDLTKDDKYLKMARITFADVAGGWDSVCGGGVYWQKPNIGKSAVQNELFMLGAIRLYQRGGGEALGKTYLEWAQDTREWFMNSGMLNEKYLVENGLNKQCEVRVGSYHTYNQGMIVSALIELYIETKDELLLDLAHKIANATIANFVYENGILKDPQEPNLSGDATQFKGIFMRHLGFLYSLSPKEEYKTFILKNADSIWSVARDKTTNEIGGVWNAHPEKTDASCQSSALDAFNAAMIVSVSN
ncbi:glycoside hydrolase family 76 protein [Labilibaculum sp.]|uniref:glycoside hydrolase family 76 protein n=1 Tax=Labilibaculum sp. TaxID=2060723 RepID=UPI003569DD42